MNPAEAPVTCALLPALNEARHLPEVLRGVAPHVAGILVVDDGSGDGTGDLARAAGAEVIRHPVPRGKGQSLREGLDWIFARDFQGALCLDADGQHAPGEIPLFLAAAPRHDLLVGNRMAERKNMPWLRWQTNRFTSHVLEKLSGARVPDTQCGFRWIRRECWKALNIESSNFEFEGEMIVAAGRGGFRVGNVPISTIYGDEVSKIRPVRDTVRFFRMVRRLHRNRGR